MSQVAAVKCSRGAEELRSWGASSPLLLCTSAPLRSPPRLVAYLTLVFSVAAAGCGAGIVPPGPLSDRLPSNGNGREGRAAILPVTDGALDARDLPAANVREPLVAGLQTCAGEAPGTLIGPSQLNGAVGEKGGMAGLNMEVGRRLLGGSGGR